MAVVYCFIVPVYNRSEEVEELLLSFRAQQTLLPSYTIIIIEDGSTHPCNDVVDRFPDLPITYYRQENTGPAGARNHGAEYAKALNAEYLIFLDSDTVLPPAYFGHLEEYHRTQTILPDLFGGPDSAHESFTTMQKAINYAMTSFLTTGGIRGGTKRVDTFYPRSFNMGVRAAVFQLVGGFSAMRFGEDVDFSMRVVAQGFHSMLLPNLIVWHKRRATLKQFFKQVHNSGMARVLLSLKHRNTFKIVHALPALFACFCCIVVMLSSISLVRGSIQSAFSILLPLILFAQLLFADAVRSTGSLRVAWYAIGASYVQLLGYGTGFLRGMWHYVIRKNMDFVAFKHTLYK